MDITLATYIHILHEMANAIKRKKYQDVLYYSMEGITYISNLSSLGEQERKLAFESLRYVCNYLTVLLEERELMNINKVIERYAIQIDFDKRIPSNLKYIKGIYYYLEKNPGCQLEDLYCSLDIPKNIISELVSSAMQLKLIYEKGSRLFLIADSPDLKKIIAS